jgi:YVTN family beta-propeller protein
MRFNGSRRGARVRAVAIACVLVAGGSAAALGALATTQHAGPQGDGTAYTSYGWRVTPAGTQVRLGERPFGAALSPDGQQLLISNDGTARQSLMRVPTASPSVAQTIYYRAPAALFQGVVYSPDGLHAYALRPFPAGLAISADGSTLYVADAFDNTLSIVDTASGHETRVALSDRTCVTSGWGDLSDGQDCLFPYNVALSHDGHTAYVSNWGQSTLDVVDLATQSVTGTISVGEHPSALALNPHTGDLYVADTDSDEVSVVDTSTNTVRQTLSLTPYNGAPVGSNPNALAVSPQGDRLYVANAGDNDVAVVRIGPGKGTLRTLGLIPTGWYPAAVEVSSDGSRIFVASAKGLGAGPNPNGPAGRNNYVGSMIRGTLQVIDVPRGTDLQAMTQDVRRNDGFLRADGVRILGAHQHVVPTSPGDPTPIKHVIIIVNENRTYDQVLGDLGKGNGDPSLTLFGNSVAPNHHSLASHFTTLDNTYAVGDVSDDGWEWTTGAEANSFDAKTWPTNYGGRGAFYAGEGGTRAAAPGRDPWQSYLWDSLDQAGISYRNYGWWATDVPPVSVYNAPNLAAHTDPAFAGFNMQIPDQDRFAAWKSEFDQYVADGNLPTVEFVKFPRDHTCGTSPSCPTPQAMVADSDLATGKLVDAVSHSPYWGSTVIFTIEDDAQDGPDHVDAHRTLAQVISPYTQTGKVDSHFYSSVSVLRTVELILGLHPLTQFDAAATPMLWAFTDKANMTPYTAITPAQRLNQMNPRTAPMAAQSQSWSFKREDLAPEHLLNQAIWESVKGAASPMPLPVHSRSILGAAGDD